MPVADAAATTQEPTPEFNQRSTDIFDRWERGELPFKDALQQLEAMSYEAQHSGKLANQGRAELLLGVIQGYRAHLDASIQHFERARTLFEQVGNRRRAVGAILNLGESHRMKGNFPRARQLFRAAFDAAVSLDDIETQAIATCNEGILLLSMEHYESARTVLERAHELAVKIEDDHRRDEVSCEIYAGLATVYIKTRHPELAWQSAQASYDAARRAGEPRMMGFALRAIGETLTKTAALPANASRGFDEDPDEYFRASTEAFQAVKAEGEVARTMYSHAMSLAARGRSMMAARKLQQAMIIFTRLGMSDDAAKAAHAQMDVLAKTGR